MNHNVVSVLNGRPAKVRCRTCHSDHDFRNEQAPPPKVDARKAALFNEVLKKVAPGDVPAVVDDAELEIIRNWMPNRITTMPKADADVRSRGGSGSRRTRRSRGSRSPSRRRAAAAPRSKLHEAMITRRTLLAGFRPRSRPTHVAPPVSLWSHPQRRGNWLGMSWNSPPSCTSRSTPSPIRNGATATKTPTCSIPEKFDADAIVGALADAGMRGVILTCKHHDGFCLWPTEDHRPLGASQRVARRQGRRGARYLAGRRARARLKFGVYLSPWDRNNAAYGTPEYIKIYRAQLTELLTGYGPIFEVWHDGANGGDGYYGGAREKRTIDKQHVLRLAARPGR